MAFRVLERGCADDFVIDVQQRFEPLLEPDGPDTVSFSPTLLAVERKHVHEAAKFAGLKSRSTGQGSERFIEVFRAGSQPALVAAAEPAEGASEGVSRDERISRMVSSILRHRAERVGVRLRPDGFARVDDILKLNTFRKIRCTCGDILNMAKSCPKQRFAIRLEGGHHWVRANQGHTIAKVEDTELLRPIASPDDLCICVHGTYWMHWESIRQNGLRAMGRNHIHFIPRIPGEQVTSGMRVDVQLAIYIDAPRAMADGCAFMWSANQVVLSRGFVGVVPPSYFVKVVALSRKFGYAKGDEVQLDGPLPRPSVAADVVSEELRLSDQEEALSSDGDDSSEEEVLLVAPMLAEAYES